MNAIEESALARRRQRLSSKYKAQALQDCRGPGVSIAGVALNHRLNANLLRRWIAEQEERA